MKTLGIMLNSEIMAPTQYDGFNFKGLCVFEGVILGCGESGIFQVSGDTDNGTDIEAFFQVPSTDLGIPAQKKVRSMILSGYQHGSLKVTIVCDNDEKTVYTLNLNGPIETGSVKVDLNSDDFGRFIGLLVENTEGSDFSIDVLDLLVLITKLGPAVRTLLGRNRSIVPVMVGEAVATIS